jgi:hypothetical protein
VNGEFLAKCITRARERLAEEGELPAIRDLLREMEESYAAFYFRGFLLLNEAAESVGISKFREVVGHFARECTQKQTITSDMFLDLIQKELGKRTRNLMEKWLAYSGKGIPE